MSTRQIIPQTHDPCALCHKPNATKRCGRCRAVVYCSRECQAAHWKSAHKLTCGASPPPVPPRPQTPGELAEDCARQLAERGYAALGPLVDRDRAILELLYSSGLRLSELTDLNLGDVDANMSQVHVTGKGNKDRIVPVGRHALKALRLWGLTRGDLANADEKALFVSNRGTRISPRSVQARVKHWAKRQGIDANVYPHLFRHSFATHVLEASHDLGGVQELLGHANISTTQVYTHLDFQHLAQIYDKTHPRARRKDK